MATQTISLSATLAEAAKVGISAPEFKKELVRAAQAHFLPATAGRWVKATLEVKPGDTLEHAVLGTSLSPMFDSLQQQEALLTARGVSHHWFYDQYHTLIYTGKQWLLYYMKEDSSPVRSSILQSYWDMAVYIDERRWCILFENVANYERYEASLIDFELRTVKGLWENFGPRLKATLGRPPKYSIEKEQARNWARTNRFAGAFAFKAYVQSLVHEDKLIPKSTMSRVFMPIWNEVAGDD